MAIKQHFARFLILFFVLNIDSLEAKQCEQETKSTQTSISFSSKTRVIALQDLSIYNILTIIHDKINQALTSIVNTQKNTHKPNTLDTVQKLEAEMQVLTTLQKFFDETTSLLNYIVNDVINTGEFKFNPDIEFKFINTYNCINLSEAVQPRHLRFLKSNIEDFNKYISDYCFIRKDSLTTQETRAFGAIAKLNNSMLDCILKDEFMGIDHWDTLVDNCFYQPLEWVFANKRLVFSISALTIAIIFYYHLVVCKPNLPITSLKAKINSQSNANKINHL